MTRDRFLESEIRCEFEVDANRKALWKCLMDMLEFVTGVCEKQGLRYYLGGGSLLGAMRHQGIIPWDDDIDIHMFREDYEKFYKLALKELPSYYFLQTSETDPEYTITHMKIRDSRTSAIPLYHVKERAVYNMGVFLDIFPIDGAAPIASRSMQLKYLKYLKMFHCYAVARTFAKPIHRVVGFVCKCFFKLIGVKRFYKLRENVASRFSTMQSDVVLSVSEFGYCDMKKREWFDESLQVPFEYLMCTVPKKWEETLTAQYRDWRKFVKGGGLHGDIVFDLKTDFKSKLINEYGYMREDFEDKPY